MKKVTKTQKISVLAILALIACLVGYILIFKHIVLLNDELSQTEKELATLDILAENKQKTISLLETTQEKRDELASRFVSIDDPTTYLESIESTAKDADVFIEVETLQVEEVKDADISNGQKEVVAVLKVEGGWSNIYQLLSLLETIPYITTVTKATFTIQEGGSMNVWSGQIHLRSVAK